MGRTRSAGDMANCGGLCREGSGGVAGTRGGRGHHQPARDHRRLEPPHRRASLQRRRLAMPADRSRLRGTRGARPALPRQNRASHRRLFQRHEDKMDPRQYLRRPLRRSRVRHHRLVAALEADRRESPRHRPHKRLTDYALQHKREALGRRIVRHPRRPGVHAP